MNEITPESVKRQIGYAQAHLVAAKPMAVSSVACAKAEASLAAAITALSTGMAGDVDDEAIRRLKNAMELARCQLQDAVMAAYK